MKVTDNVIPIDFARAREARELLGLHKDGASLQKRIEAREAELSRQRRLRSYKAWVCRQYQKHELPPHPTDPALR